MDNVNNIPAPNEEELEESVADPNVENVAVPNEENDAVPNEEEPHNEPAQPHQLTLEEAERRMKKTRKRVCSTVKGMFRKTKKGRASFSKEVEAIHEAKEVKEEDEEKDDIGDNWDYEKKPSDDEENEVEDFAPIDDMPSPDAPKPLVKSRLKGWVLSRIAANNGEY